MCEICMQALSKGEAGKILLFLARPSNDQRLFFCFFLPACLMASSEMPVSAPPWRLSAALLLLLAASRGR